MPKQAGVFKIRGKMGDFSFYKSKEGFMVRQRGGISADRIKNDPAFERTRENGAEFGRAGYASKVLRNALRVTLQNSSDSRLTSRLTREMFKVVRADSVNARGQRKVLALNTEMLTGFEFNLNGKLSSSFLVSYTSDIDRVAGTMQVDLPAFVPAHRIAAPSGTTHVRLVAAGLSMDFETGKFVADEAYSAHLEWSSQTVAALALSLSVTPGSVDPLFLAFGVEFYQEVNGQLYPLKNGSYNSLSLVKVNGIV